jgi:hypothetical protein
VTRPVEREAAGPAAKGLFLAGLAAVAVGRYVGRQERDRDGRGEQALEVGHAE